MLKTLCLRFFLLFLTLLLHGLLFSIHINVGITMKKSLVLLLLAFSSSAFSADAVIGIYCQENTNGAKVYLNDSYKFDCEDFQREAFLVDEGTYQIRAVLSVNKEKEKIFSASIEASSSRPQRVRVILPAASLTAYGVEMKVLRDQEAARRLALEKERKLAAAVKSDIEKSEKGDLKAIQRLISRYQTGDGVDQDPQKVSFWTDQYQALKKEKDRQIKLAALNKELEANPYFYWLGLFPRAIENSNSSASSTMVTGLPSLTVVDLLSSPSIYSTRRGIQNRIEDLEVHAVRWANPDSMVAQASQ